MYLFNKNSAPLYRNFIEFINTTPTLIKKKINKISRLTHGQANCFGIIKGFMKHNSAAANISEA